MPTIFPRASRLLTAVAVISPDPHDRRSVMIGLAPKIAAMLAAPVLKLAAMVAVPVVAVLAWGAVEDGLDKRKNRDKDDAMSS
jgi:hypothetical protein